MMINEFAMEYNNLVKKRKVEGLKALFDEVVGSPDRYEDFIIDLLGIASDLEADDYFGTEGLDV
ncbi:hypothetical protein PHIM7_148 [Sinorhizobium phage phiM7]|uniref:Uncharacterized protein n=2 Tax=Emdodecavirus TaxID=1980937 RepID=S5MB41_9CAUD|nr:hypothetical protein AB690_gp349 [Sinorhizobium phage phiM12]YP_009601273.1 hypothetical protein FDH46_gp330 [Sinorhizobium phage phiM7]AGR47848.2 hypothetical protein SmphiM12_216 [Sinorhizobium phage phiM12]AKF12694.1 hypothetical protein PHIM7_148 [Sinorhizobium phage phiM7]AKF13053.1 hypothetical protein PHIM19_148 [Sinorhizobium phage phiM19]